MRRLVAHRKVSHAHIDGEGVVRKGGVNQERYIVGRRIEKSIVLQIVGYAVAFFCQDVLVVVVVFLQQGCAVPLVQQLLQECYFYS